MKNLTNVVLEAVGLFDHGNFDHHVELGALGVNGRNMNKAERGAHRVHFGIARDEYARVRVRHGLPSQASALLTHPSDNLKLDKGITPAYGITLQHYVQKLSSGLTVNACPWAGDCTKVCVLDNGMGRFNSVQLGRRAKTEFLATNPLAFAYLLGRELAQAVKRDGAILLRPNVNSDVEWERIAPLLCAGQTPHLFGAVRLYGSSKNPAILDTDGWLAPAYRVAYSWNESTDGGVGVNRVARFLERGGSVAMVTNRKPKSPVGVLHLPWATRVPCPPVLDADKSDEWIFTEGCIGDLSAKGKARKLIGSSGFVVEAYS
jgi:hypothetical protein